MKKRILCIFLALLLAVQLCPLTALAANREPLQFTTITNPLYPELAGTAPTIQAPRYAADSRAVYTSDFETAANQLRVGMANRQEHIVVYYHTDHPASGDDLYAFLYAAYEHTGVPNQGEALHWCWAHCSWSASTTRSGSGYNLQLIYNFVYKTSAAEEKQLTAKINSVLHSFGFTAATSNYDKVKAIYDYITANVVYEYAKEGDPAYAQRGTPYAAMIKGSAICNGFALLFYRMCLEAGVKCRYVHGDTAGGYHAWDVVQMDNGLYYWVDATWDAEKQPEEYLHFLRGSDYFPGHLPRDPHNTPEFIAEQPVPKEDYIAYPDHEHSIIQYQVTYPTCTESGYSDCRFCRYCRYTTEQLTPLPAKGHDYVGTPAPDATCTKSGTMEYVCANDSSHTYSEPIPAKGHSDGDIDLHCDVCGTETYVAAHNPFRDLHRSDYYYEPVLWAVYHNVTSGVGGGRFAPKEACTRAQVVTFLWRAAGKPAPNSSKNPFDDVKQGAFYYDAVLWAVENGITSGTSANLFSPNTPCTRAQVATFLYRAQGEPDTESTAADFSDVNSKDYFYDAVIWAVENGITTGVGKGKFAPNSPCTRSQITTFLYRAQAET